MTEFDAVLVLSFGGPEGPDDVLPFLHNVVRGRNVPPERLAQVASQYELFDGVSPINQQNRDLIQALIEELRGASIELPVYWGNRNWHPFLSATVQQMTNDGVRSALVFVTSAFGSYSGCGQYLDDLEAASVKAIGDPPSFQKLRLFYNHPGFIEPTAANVRSAVAEHLTENGTDRGKARSLRVVFTAHSIPISMAGNCQYQQQLEEAARLVASGAGIDDSWDLVFQSRSGPPGVAWLEPDISDHLRALAADGLTGVVVAPLGFISDHMEVIFDLDTVAARTASEVGLRMTRARTVGTDPRFVAMIRELIEEQLLAAPKLWLGPDGPWPDRCPEGHCRPTRRQP